MKKQGIIPAFVILIVLLPVTVFALVSWYEARYERLPVLSKQGTVVGNFSFWDQQGSTVTREGWKNRIVVANYFFTHCPVVCPKMTAQLKRVQAAHNSVQICSFSVDPERDSVKRLAAYASQFGIQGHWSLLTGDKRELYRFARKELQLVATDGDGGPGDFIHSDNMVLIDRQQRIRGYYKGTDATDMDRLIKDIQKLEKE
jgi:protein SCO1/2